MNKFYQFLYEKISVGFAKKVFNKKGGDWCLICSICFLVSMTTGIPLYPKLLNWLLKRHKGFVGGLVIWDVLADVLGININKRLWDGTNHPDIDSIKTPCIISIDGIKSTKEYDSHFIVLIKKLKDVILVYDPFIGSTKVIDNPEIFSVIELEI